MVHKMKPNSGCVTCATDACMEALMSGQTEGLLSKLYLNALDHKNGLDDFPHVHLF